MNMMGSISAGVQTRVANARQRRQVYTNTRVCGPNAVKLSGLSDGLYQCVLVINGKAALMEKLVIFKE